MDIRESVKHMLRMCGDAAASTVHQRLNVIEAEVQDGLATHTALLQSNIHLVQAIPALRQEIREGDARLAEQIRDFGTGRSEVHALRDELQELKRQLETHESKVDAADRIRKAHEHLRQQLEQSIEMKFGAVHTSVDRLREAYDQVMNACEGLRND